MCTGGSLTLFKPSGDANKQARLPQACAGQITGAEGNRDWKQTENPAGLLQDKHWLKSVSLLGIICYFGSLNHTQCNLKVP